MTIIIITASVYCNNNNVEKNIELLENFSKVILIILCTVECNVCAKKNLLYIVCFFRSYVKFKIYFIKF